MKINKKNFKWFGVIFFTLVVLLTGLMVGNRSGVKRSIFGQYSSKLSDYSGRDYRTSDSPLEFKRKTRISSSNERVSSETTTEDIKIDDDGNILIPKKLANRIRIYPLTSDFQFDMNEMKLFGFNEEEVAKLQKLIDREKNIIFDDELHGFKIISENTDEAVLEIPASPEKVESNKNALINQIQAICGEKSSVLLDPLTSAVGGLSGSFGENDRIIKVTSDGDGENTYEILELTPSAKQVLSSNNAGYSDYQRMAITTRRYKSADVPKRLQHLFVQ